MDDSERVEDEFSKDWSISWTHFTDNSCQQKPHCIVSCKLPLHIKYTNFCAKKNLWKHYVIFQVWFLFQKKFNHWFDNAKHIERAERVGRSVKISYKGLKDRFHTAAQRQIIRVLLPHNFINRTYHAKSSGNT